MTRRQLKKRQENAPTESSPLTKKASIPLAHNETANTTATRSSKGRLWRERLASTKALLGVGTSDACREVRNRPNTSERGRQSRCLTVLLVRNVASQALDLISSFFVDLQLQIKMPATTEEPIIGALEHRLCAQCVVLLVRLSTKDATRRHLKSATSACATCASIPVLQPALLTAGVLAAITPLLEDRTSLRNRGDDVTYAVIEAVLQTACRLAREARATEQMEIEQMISALAPLISAPTPETLGVLSARVLTEMIAGDDQKRVAVSSSPAALDGLVAACHATHRPRVLVQAVSALASLAARESYDVVLTDAGAVKAFLHICAHGEQAEELPESPDDEGLGSHASELAKAVPMALDALANLADSALARHIIVEEGGVEVLVPILVSTAPVKSLYQSAGWVVVSLAVDPELGERAVAAGALSGLLAYAASESEREREEAAWALANLSAVSTNAEAMSDARVLAALASLVRSGGDQPKVCMQAVWAVANLAVHAKLKHTLADDHGMVEALLEQIRQRLVTRGESASTGVVEVGTICEDADYDETEMVRSTLLQSMRALANLAAEPANRSRIDAGDGLMTVLRAASVFDFDNLREVSARCLVSLTFDAAIAQRFVELGGVPVLVHGLLSSEEAPERVQHEALLIALNVSTRQPATLLGGPSLAALLGFLDPQPPGEDDARLPELSARVLSNLCAASASSKAALFEHGALSRLNAFVRRGDEGAALARATAASVLKELMAVLTPTSRRALSRATCFPTLDGEAAAHMSGMLRRRRDARGVVEGCGAAPRRSSPLARMSWTAAGAGPSHMQM